MTAGLYAVSPTTADLCRARARARGHQMMLQQQWSQVVHLMLGKLNLMAVLLLVTLLVQLAHKQHRYMGRTTTALYQNRATPCSLRLEATTCILKREGTTCSPKLEATLYSPRLRAVTCSPRPQVVVETTCSEAR